MNLKQALQENNSIRLGLTAPLSISGSTDNFTASFQSLAVSPSRIL